MLNIQGRRRIYVEGPRFSIQETLSLLKDVDGEEDWLSKSLWL